MNDKLDTYILALRHDIAHIKTQLDAAEDEEKNGIQRSGGWLYKARYNLRIRKIKLEKLNYERANARREERETKHVAVLELAHSRKVELANLHNNDDRRLIDIVKSKIPREIFDECLDEAGLLGKTRTGKNKKKTHSPR